MEGRDVDRQLLDNKAYEAVVAVREAFAKVDTLFEFLKTVPNDGNGGDPLTLSTIPENPMDPTTVVGKFGYTTDEAYLLRIVFEGLHGLDTNVQPLLDTGRRLTGLE